MNNSREPVNCPDTSPFLNISSATPGTQTLRYSDSMTPDSAAKPFGATELQLFCVVADEAATDPNAGKFVGKFTRNPINVDFVPAVIGRDLAEKLRFRPEIAISHRQTRDHLVKSRRALACSPCAQAK